MRIDLGLTVRSSWIPISRNTSSFGVAHARAIFANRAKGIENPDESMRTLYFIRYVWYALAINSSKASVSPHKMWRVGVFSSLPRSPKSARLPALAVVHLFKRTEGTYNPTGFLYVFSVHLMFD
jgi:hypothetical protein